MATCGLATDETWFKNLWQFLAELGITLETAPEVQLAPIRENDFSLNNAIATGPFTEEEKVSFNRCKNHKCVVHVSDVISCDGKTVEPSILTDDPGESSKHKFPYENPTKKDYKVWRRGIEYVTSSTHQLQNRLGKYTKETHRKMRWSASNDCTKLYFEYDASEDGAKQYGIYEKDKMAQTTRFGQRYSEKEVRIGIPPVCKYASIRQVSKKVVTLHSTVARPLPPLQHSTFWAILRSFPNQSMWRNFICDGDGEWIHRGML